jgi:hypothetical protein
MINDKEYADPGPLMFLAKVTAVVAGLTAVLIFSALTVSTVYKILGEGAECQPKAIIDPNPIVRGVQ